MTEEYVLRQSLSRRVATAAVLGAGVPLLLLIAVVEGGAHGWLCYPLAVLLSVVLVRTWRLRAVVGRSEVVVANVLRTHRLPLAEIRGVVGDGAADGVRLVLRSGRVVPVSAYAPVIPWALPFVDRRYVRAGRELSRAVRRARRGR